MMTYCGQVTKSDVMKRFPLIPERCITSLRAHEPHQLHVYDGRDMYRLRVTGVPSSFSPGSLMFLFERLQADLEVERRILYTGDFRLDDSRGPLSSLPSLQSLHHNGFPLPLDELYLDTTFCSLAYPAFPARRNAEQKIWEVCQRWVRRNGMFKDTNPQHVVLLELSSTGHQSILQTIHHKSLTKWKVHVMEESQASCWTSSDPRRAPWLHACGGLGRHRRLDSLPCQRGQFQVCVIRPTATPFNKNRMAELEKAGQDPGMVVSEDGSHYKFCYSNHPSLLETETFVRHFSPHLITPLALPHRSHLQPPSSHSSHDQVQQGPTEGHSCLFPGHQSGP